MIDRQQLAEALARLEPRDREVLELSLRRRVPDEDLAVVLETSAGGVAQLRARAVDRLSQDLGVQRGEDLGHMLKQLLEGATWALLAQAEMAAAPDHPSRGAAAQPPSAQPAADEHEPVLGMLAEDPAEEHEEAHRGGGRRLLTGAAVALAVLAPAGMVAALTTGGADGRGEDDGASSPSLPFEPARDAVAEPFPSDPESANRHPVATVGGRTTLRASPGGKVRARIAGKTEWRSPRVLSVVERRGAWLAVLAPELRNGEVGWVRASRVRGLGTVAWSLHADLSKRKLVVRRDGRTVRTMRIGVGRAGHSTPVGRFAVTDKLKVSSPDSPYGCCVLALTGHQTKLPKGWPGGDRLAIHATRDTSGLGQAVSLGCMRSHPRDARWMLKTLPLGAPVFVRR